MALTAAGESLFGHARIVLQDVETMRGDLAAFASGAKASVHMLDNTVGLSIEGPQVLSAMDSIMADDKGLSDAIRKGRQPDADQGLLLEKIFNQKGPVSATVSGPVANLFDYPAEVAAAKAAQAAMYQRLGISPTAPVPQTPMFSPAPAAPAGR